MRQRRTARDEPGDVDVAQVVEPERPDALAGECPDEFASDCGMEVAGAQQQTVAMATQLQARALRRRGT